MCMTRIRNLSSSITTKEEASSLSLRKNKEWQDGIRIKVKLFRKKKIIPSCGDK
uniref:Uncharacterized protein n=1 Tax=Rhizophora mucronata TaxID=61149 RepID=A0A2P2KA45_RHIMU